MAVKPFYHLHDLTNLSRVKAMRTMARNAHEAIQKLEGGAKYTTSDQANAAFAFLNLIGFYPGETHTHMLTKEGDRYEVQSTNRSYAWKGWYSRHALLGPGGHRYAVMLNPVMAMDAIKQSWPKAVVHIGETSVETVEDKRWLVTVREGGYDKKPLASGSAICSNETVALMQAYVRMLEDVLSRCIGMIHEAKKVPAPSIDPVVFFEGSLGKTDWVKRAFQGRGYQGHNYPWVCYDESHSIKLPQTDPLTPEEATWLLKVRRKQLEK